MRSTILLALMPAMAVAQSLDCTIASLNQSLFGTHASLVSARSYANGTYTYAGSLNKVEFCAVDASISYGQNDTLQFSVWLPRSDTYQNRFMAVGNGGFAGTIDYANMLAQLNAGHGFVVAGGDAGHRAVGNTGSPGVELPFLHDPDQVQAWIHNAISLFTPAAKHLVAAYYGSKAKHSYYDGCSTGGAQGFALANFHPHLFDGIIAGSPGNWYSHLALSFLWNAQQTKAPSRSLPQAVLDAITNAVLDKCDSIDGVNDRLLENPLACSFDPDTLRCSTAVNNSTACLTADQLDAVKEIYQGPVRFCSGEQVYPGFSFGSETQWQLQEGALANLFSIPILQNLVFDDLSYNSDSFDWESDVDRVDEKAGRYIDEKNPDLSRFRKRGGKLLVTQGWADPFNAATWPIEQLHQVQEQTGDVSNFFRLFMIPGGGHCGAASNYPSVPALYHTVDQMVKWVESSHAPDYVISSDPPDGSNKTRRLCPWPQVARLEQGSIDDWTSYTCV